MHNYRKLTVYHRARAFAREVYFLTTSVSRPEARLVTSQLRRCALGISSTISEGCGKNSRAETIRYLEISCGSVAESEHHLSEAAELAILSPRKCAQLEDEAVQILRMLRALIENFPK
jgi:four helix bundle protein